jgi:phosphoglycolate phosphatase-like HAD superfamily hydrolase
MKKSLKKFLLSFCLLSHPVFAQFKNAERVPWVYFDLGDTVIDTKDMKHLHYIKGAREYMEQLKREGFKIGIITNIPETWGMDYEEKLQTLKKMIHDGWDEKSPFDWEIYDEVILPLKNNEMKPSPTMYLKAIQKSNGCPSAFIGESPKEVDAAKINGMAGKLFVEKDKDLFIPIGTMNQFMKENYKLKYDSECLDA